MLVKYQMLTRNLLNDATFARCNDFDLRTYINVARGQIATQGDCIPGYGFLQVVPMTQQYSFASIEFPGDTQQGIAGAIAIRTLLWQVGEGHKRIFGRAWPWFNQYELAQPVPKEGEPRVWSQFGQGASGSIFLNKLDRDYRITVDARCYPIELVDDTTPEALPYQWTDAVPWFAAFYYLTGTGQNPQAASAMLQAFGQFMQMARGGSTPAVQSNDFVGSPDPFMPGRLGITPPGTRGAHPRQSSNPPTAL